MTEPIEDPRVTAERDFHDLKFLLNAGITLPPHLQVIADRAEALTWARIGSGQNLQASRTL